ncbi:MAG TPA: HAMP domain-containing protein, partial [Terriglobales bacterium]|nr:HAMP domain-containing protein [Terriglobales bacterium]
MRTPRLTLAGKFLLAICPFLITSSIGTAIQYVALHRAERAFEQAISQEHTFDVAARETATSAVRVGIGTLGYLRQPSPEQRQRAERARAQYWRNKARYDALLSSGETSPERLRLADAFDRFAQLSQTLIEQQDAAEPQRQRMAAAEQRWREAAQRAGRIASRHELGEVSRLLASSDSERRSYEAAIAPMTPAVDELLRLRDSLDELLEQGHRAAAELAASNQMAVIAAQKGITLVWIAAILQCTVGVAAILLLGRSVRRRIDRLSVATAAVSAGNLATRVPDAGGDELADLTRGFNQMADQLERTTVSRTQLEEQEAALRRSEQRQRLLVERLKDCAIFTVDSAGVITSWNAGAERLFGYGAGTAIGLELARLYSEPAELTARQHLDVAAGDGGHTVEATQVRRDGSTFLAEVSITPLDDIRRSAEHVVLVRDVTVQRATGLER